VNLDNLVRGFRALRRRQSFLPFQIEFTSGDRLVVRHPEAVGQYGQMFIYWGPDRQQRIFDAESVCQLIVPAPTVSS
jgi:hypothetical protein